MIRIALGVLLLAVVIVAAIAILGEPGTASLTWLGWRVNTTAAAGVLIIGLLALAAILFWSAVVWVLGAPARAARAAADSRRRTGAEALTRGFLAAAAGDGPEARRQAQRAAGLAGDTPQLARILTAQAAEAAGDAAGARAAYEAMVGFPEMRLAAHRGFMLLAAAEGDRAEALRQARLAHGLRRTAPWAWWTLLEGSLEAGDWLGAQTLVDDALERRIVSPLVAERARAALGTTRAALEGARGADLAVAAARTRPDFPPAAVVAARLLAAEGKAGRAGPLLEGAWKATAHPAVWLAWRDLRGDETPADRAHRLAALAALNPGARESRILTVEQALIAGDAAAAEAALQALAAEPVTERLAGLNARVAFALGRRDEARAWIARAAGAPLEAEWSDLDREGRAFAYSPADWARLVLAYARTGELLHPRHERGEPAYGDLPQMPEAYVASAPFIGAAEGDPFGPIVDDGDFAEALQPAGPGDAGTSRPFRPFGRRQKG